MATGRSVYVLLNIVASFLSYQISNISFQIWFFSFTLSILCYFPWMVCGAVKCAKTHKCANAHIMCKHFADKCANAHILCKHFAHKCANNHICTNISPTNVQICKNYINHKCANITPTNVQTFSFDVKCANNIPQMCKSLSSSRISLLQPN